MRLLFGIIMLGLSQLSLGDEVPKELKAELVNRFVTLLCKDDLFKKCVEKTENKCKAAVSFAINSCDYSPVWDEINTQDGSNEIKRAVGDEFGACVNDNIQKILKVKPQKYEQCMISSFDNHIDKTVRERKQ